MNKSLLFLLSLSNLESWRNLVQSVPLLLIWKISLNLMNFCSWTRLLESTYKEWYKDGANTWQLICFRKYPFTYFRPVLQSGLCQVHTWSLNRDTLEVCFTVLWQLKSFSINSSCGDFISWAICQQKVNVLKTQGFPRKTNPFFADYGPYLNLPQKEQPHFLFSDWIQLWVLEEFLLIKLETKFNFMHISLLTFMAFSDSFHCSEVYL